MYVFFPYEVKGKDSLAELKGGFLICSNHISNLDAIFISVAVNRKIYFLAKSELFRNPIFSFFLKKFGAICIRRGENDFKALSKAKEILKSHQILGIFIEGTRSKTGKFLRPKSGATIIANETKSPILPICITPEGGKKVKIFKKTTIYLGTPIEKITLESNEYKEIRHATEFIMSEVKKLRKLTSEGTF